jgi:hypothetical protein
VDQKAEKVEQFVCGTIAAVISRVWVVLITAFLIHSKQEKVYQEIYEVTRAKRTVCLNTIRYYFGLFLVLITVSKFNPILKLYHFSYCYFSSIRFCSTFRTSLSDGLGMDNYFCLSCRSCSCRRSLHYCSYISDYDSWSGSRCLWQVPQPYPRNGPRSYQECCLVIILIINILSI